MSESHKKSLKICLIIPSLQAGGMERVMSELATFFAKKNNLEVHLVLYGINREIFYSIPQNVVIHRPRFPFKNRSRFISTLKTLFFLRKEIKIINPITILSFGEYWNSFVLLALFGLKFPIYISDRSQPDKSLGRLHDQLRKWLYPKATGVIAQTSAAKSFYQKLYHHENIRVIGNPIRSITTENGNRENIVLTVGRLIQSKNHDKLIQLFANINLPGWKLVVVGYDHLKQQNLVKLEKLISNLQMEDKVEIVGKQADVDAYYRKSKIFAFTSTSEGFPNVIGEALSAGLPVVAFDCMAGPADMIEDGKNGFLIPNGNYDLFRSRLDSLMNDEVKQLEMGEMGMRSIKKFSVDSIGEEYFQFITTSKRSGAK